MTNKNAIVAVDGYRDEQWYLQMVEDLHAIAVETVYRSRMELILGKYQVGERICLDPKFKKFPGSKTAFLSNLFRDSNLGERDGYYCVNFYETYPNFRTDVQSFQEGKNLTWNKIKQNYLTAPKTPKVVLPPGKYGVIYADPAWPYPAHMDVDKLYGVAQQHYDIMSIKEIAALPVAESAAENSVLFMWVATLFLEDCFKILEAWGYEYKSQIVWVKEGGSGIGYYVRSNHELLIIATKGSYLPKSKDYVSSVVKHKRLEHSQKPEIFYDIIEQLYPDDKYLELFARNNAKRKGWTFWGNQANH